MRSRIISLEFNHPVFYINNIIITIRDRGRRDDSKMN